MCWRFTLLTWLMMTVLPSLPLQEVTALSSQWLKIVSPLYGNSSCT